MLLSIVAVVGAYFWYTSSLEAVNENNKEIKTVKIESGKGTVGIAQILKENNLIKSDLSFKIYCKINNITKLQAGEYELDSTMSVEQIIKKMEAGEIVKK